MFLRLLHRLFEIFLHFMRRWIDPVFRPPFNYLLRDYFACFFTFLINLQRSRENVGLAEETRQPGEEQDVQTMIDEMRHHLVIDFPPGGFERAGNTKTHGLVQGTLVILQSAGKLRPIRDTKEFSVLGPLLRSGAAYRTRYRRCRFCQHQRQGDGGRG